MRHRAELAAETALAGLGRIQLPLQVNGRVAIAPQVHLGWDEDEGAAAVTLLPEPGGLIAIKAEVVGAPRWVNLSIGLGEVAFQAGELPGLALDAALTPAGRLSPLLRTEGGGPTVDTVFDEGIALDARLAPRVALRPLRQGEGILRPAGIRWLILPLPCDSFLLRIRALRMFVLDRPGLAALDDQTLGSFA